MDRRLLLASLAIAFSASTASMGQAVPAAQPALAPLPWMKPGVRLTYYQSRGESKTWQVKLVPDQNGEWVDANSGRHLSEQQVLGLDREPGIDSHAGYGVRVNDVVAVESDGTIAVDAKIFLIGPDLKSLVLQPGGRGLVGSVEAGPALWIHPRRLAAILADAEAKPRDPAADHQVFRTTMPAPDGARPYDAVRIVDFDGASHIQQTYDLDTGLMLLEASIKSNVAQGQQIVGPGGQRYFDRGGTVVTYTRFVGVRRLKLPPAEAETPPLPSAFARAGQTFLWRGGYKMQSNLDPALDAQIPPSPIGFACQVLQAGRGFAVASIRDVTPGQPPDVDPTQRVIGTGTLGGWAIAPAVFAGLQPGAVLDDDPITHGQIVYLGAGQDGLQYVDERGPLHRYTYGYEPQSGLMRRQTYTFGGSRVIYNVQLFDR